MNKVLTSIFIYLSKTLSDLLSFLLLNCTHLSIMLQVAIEAIYTIIQTVLYTLILYSMIGFEWGFVKFIYFCYFITTCFIYFGMYGMMLVSLTPGHQVAGIVMGFFLSLWNLFAGFLIPRPVWCLQLIHVQKLGCAFSIVYYILVIFITFPNCAYVI